MEARPFCFVAMVCGCPGPVLGSRENTNIVLRKVL
jgi:hypothetical protein